MNNLIYTRLFAITALSTFCTSYSNNKHSAIEKEELAGIPHNRESKKNLTGLWGTECGAKDSQKTILRLENGKFEQFIQLFLEKGCPPKSLAAEYHASGNYNLGKTINKNPHQREFDYIQNKFDLTIYHRTYLLAYNGLNEFSYLKPFCKNHEFQIMTQTPLVGKKCLTEGSDEYLEIKSLDRHHVTIEITNQTLKEATGDLKEISRNGSKRLTSFRNYISYSRVDPITITKK